jgi:uncharacterized protein YbjQ (UPF0145 family)
MLIVTTDDLAGHEIRKVLGEVLGVAVQADQGRAPAAGSPSSGTFRMTGERPAAGLAQTRREALQRLGEEAHRKGANAVVGMCFDNARLAGGTHEVCAYGTAVWAEPARGAGREERRQQHPAHQAPPYGGEPQQPGGPPMVARNLTIGLHGDRPR